jgi:hypothetical protein
MAKQTQIPLTERQANALSRLLSERLYGKPPKGKPRNQRGKPQILRDILDKLDHAVFLEE